MVTGGEQKKVPRRRGMYPIVLTVDDDTYKQGLKVEPDPTTPNALFTPDQTRRRRGRGPAEGPSGED